MDIGLLIRYHQNFSEWALFADALGIKGIEIAYQDEGDYDIDSKPILEAFKDRKVKVCALSMFHVNTLADDPKEKARANELNNRLIETAARVGAPIAVIGMGYNDKKSLDQNINEFLPLHKYYNDKATDLGVKLAYYLGHPPNITNTLEGIDRIVELVPDINLKVDAVGIIRHLKVTPQEVIRRIGHRIIHFHCKDILRYEEYEIEPPVGMGEVEWNRVIAMLYDHNYDSYIVIEPHGPMWRNEDKIADYIVISKRHLEQYLA